MTVIEEFRGCVTHTPNRATPQPEGGFSIEFPDVPEAISQGDTEEEVHAMAEDALLTALSFYTDASEPLPNPSPANGLQVAYVPSLVAAKLALHDAMIKGRVSNVALGQRPGVDEKIIRRLRDPLHRSHIANVEAALRTFGQRLLADVHETT
jgi:antitoxin HicB